MSEIDLENGADDPADLFENPDAVVHHPTLTREQKVQILNNWQLDASRLEGSEGEGMKRGEDAPMLHPASAWRSRLSWGSSTGLPRRDADADLVPGAGRRFGWAASPVVV